MILKKNVITFSLYEIEQKKIKAPKTVEPDGEPFEVQSIVDLLNDSRKNC